MCFLSDCVMSADIRTHGASLCKFFDVMLVCIDTGVALLRLREHSMLLVIENELVFWVCIIVGGLS